jgi:putative peptide zinc metalloprotease protein
VVAGALNVSDSLFSPQWYRVAHLKVRVGALVRVQRQRWRDQDWVLLFDDATGRQHRINDVAYQFIGRCDGRHTVQQVWDATLEACGDAAPTQDEVIRLLADFNNRQLVQFDRAPDTDALFQRRQERTQRRRQSLINPLAFRVPLTDPSAWLQSLDPLALALFNRRTFTVWAAAVVAAALAAAADWNALHGYAAVHLLTPRHRALTFICFPLMKAAHELGHALAIRRWGGAVREVGITLLALVPAPYVDASSAAAFRRRLERVVVGAAGIMVELALAAVALTVWVNVQPGLVQDVAFAVMVIGAASTVLVNGNPLVRFDGYYVACDLLDLPNLATRSAAYWTYLSHRYLARGDVEAPQIAAGERKWLVAYAPFSQVYRFVMAIAIVLWIGRHAMLPGIAAAIYFALVLAVQPLVRWGRDALASAASGRELDRVRLALGALMVSAVIFFLVLPLPYRTVAPAIVWLPEQTEVRPEVDGFIAELPRRDGEWVQAGDVVAVLENPELEARRNEIANQLDALHVERYRRLLRDPLKAGNIAVEIERAEAELARANERIAQLRVSARAAGRLVMPRQADLPGSFVRTGSTLGHVLAAADLRIRAAVDEDDAGLVRQHTRSAEVRLAEYPSVTLPAKIVADTPAATHELPAAALGDRGGGPYVTDPSAEGGTHSLEPVFLFDLKVQGPPLDRVGGRAWVRFSHPGEPLAFQAYVVGRRLFLKHFDAS